MDVWETQNQPKGLTAKYMQVEFAENVRDILADFALEKYGKNKVTVAEKNKHKKFIKECRSDIEKDLLQAPRKALFESLEATVESLAKFQEVYNEFLNLHETFDMDGGVRRRRPTKTPKTKK